MTDVNGKTPTNGAPQPAQPPKARKPMAGPKAGDARISPVIPSMSDSLAGEFASEGASSVAKPKSSTPSAAKSARAAGASAASRPAAARAQALRDWALIRREEAKDAVRTHPLGSSVIVFAAGLIFGLLLARR